MEKKKKNSDGLLKIEGKWMAVVVVVAAAVMVEAREGYIVETCETTNTLEPPPLLSPPHKKTRRQLQPERMVLEVLEVLEVTVVMKMQSAWRERRNQARARGETRKRTTRRTKRRSGGLSAATRRARRTNNCKNPIPSQTAQSLNASKHESNTNNRAKQRPVLFEKH